MKYVIVLIVGLVVGYFVGRRSRGGVKKNTETLPQPEVVKSFDQEQREKKLENLGRVMDLVTLRQAQGLTGITNNDVEKELKVSNATAERYLEEMEREGKIVQVGDTGQGVYYKIK